MALQPVQWIMYFLFLKWHLALDTTFIYISDQTAAIKMWGREKGACHPLTMDFNCEEENLRGGKPTLINYSCISVGLCKWAKQGLISQIFVKLLRIFWPKLFFNQVKLQHRYVIKLTGLSRSFMGCFAWTNPLMGLRPHFIFQEYFCSEYILFCIFNPQLALNHH